MTMGDMAWSRWREITQLVIVNAGKSMFLYTLVLILYENF
jgi:hypothetical protein